MKKKLIEVALPLEAINKESAREKSIRHGHPSTLHLWWSRKPLATCRAVWFAQLVDDPASLPEQFPTEEAQEKERQRLFRIIEELVKWENINNETVLNAARAEILKSTGGNPPPVYDPFCGGGSIPLEAQRLGLEAHGSDLNPVAVLITKALIEIPPKFAGMAPVNPRAKTSLLKGGTWKGAQGLAEDVRYYGQWMRDEAEKRIGHLYPKATLPGGGDATVIAWLFCRTVKCPNPACGAMMPLTSKFVLSTKKGKEAWVEPVVTPGSSGNPPAIAFEVKTGKGTPPEGTVNRRGARCVACGTPVPFDHVRSEGKAGRMNVEMMAMVAEGERGRIYLSADQNHIQTAEKANPTWRPDSELPHNPRDFKTPNYGMQTFGDLFTSRQLVALTTFSDLVGEARKKILTDAEDSGLSAEQARAYADGVATYLTLGVSRLTDICNSLCRWENTKTQVRNLFGRQAIPMIWDYAEPNIFAEAAGDYGVSLDNLLKALEKVPSKGNGNVKQCNASLIADQHNGTFKVISTDPPYYDNIGYADLSDFFYVWLRRSLKDIYPDILSTMLVPKASELIASPYRFGGDKQKAQKFFEDGLGQAFAQMCKVQHHDFPLTVYYAFKQSETDEDQDGEGNTTVVASTGWETMLEGLIQAGFLIDGTWPMRSELSNRMIASGTNALASSIVLVCRPRPETAPIVTRREFLNALKRELPDALKKLQHGNIAPVDLAQASIGPGIGVYSRTKKVIEADGSAMTVRTALQLINRALDEYLSEQEGELDNDTRFAVTWYENYGFQAASYGDAETLAKARNVSVSGVVEAGILHSAAGKVRLLKRSELQPDYDPLTDERFTVWEAMQYLIKHIEEHGEQSAAEFLKKLGPVGEQARALAYRLYSSCERRGWAEEAGAYNSLVIAWPELEQLATRITTTTPKPGKLF